MIRQTAASLVALNAVLFLLGVVWFPVLLVVQGLVSVVALGILYFWIAQLDDDLEEEIKELKETEQAKLATYREHPEVLRIPENLNQRGSRNRRA